jgi:hypothetical protein
MSSRGSSAMRSGQRGQGMVEFAIVSMILFTVTFGIMDFAFFYLGKIAATNATRSAARFAAVSPGAWTNTDPPAANTIESRLILAAIPANITNQDYAAGRKSYVTITYLIPGSGSGTVCGQYYINPPGGGTAGFVGASKAGGGTYAQNECVVAGNVVTVKANYTYKFITPFLNNQFNPGTLTITTEATELIEGSAS